VFLLLAATNRTILAAWAAFSVAFACNLVFAVPPPELSLPDAGLISVIGALVITGVTFVALQQLARYAEPSAPAEPAGPAAVPVGAP